MVDKDSEIYYVLRVVYLNIVDPTLCELFFYNESRVLIHFILQMNISLILGQSIPLCM